VATGGFAPGPLPVFARGALGADARSIRAPTRGTQLNSVGNGLVREVILELFEDHGRRRRPTSRPRRLDFIGLDTLRSAAPTLVPAKT